MKNRLTLALAMAMAAAFGLAACKQQAGSTTEAADIARRTGQDLVSLQN